MSAGYLTNFKSAEHAEVDLFLEYWKLSDISAAMRYFDINCILKSFWSLAAFISMLIHQDKNYGVCLGANGTSEIYNITSDVTNDTFYRLLDTTSQQPNPNTYSSGDNVSKLHAVCTTTCNDDLNTTREIKAIISEFLISNTSVISWFDFIFCYAFVCNANSLTSVENTSLMNHQGKDNEEKLCNQSLADANVNNTLSCCYNFNDTGTAIDSNLFKEIYPPEMYTNMSNQTCYLVTKCNDSKNKNDSNSSKATNCIALHIPFGDVESPLDRLTLKLFELMKENKFINDPFNCSLAIIFSNYSNEVRELVNLIPTCVHDKYQNQISTLRSRLYIGDNCSQDRECEMDVNFTVCVDQTCSCAEGFFPVNNHTCVKRILRDPCNDTQDCVSVEYADCINGTCQCLSEYKETNFSCVNRTVGDNCYNDYDCRLSSNSYCINNTCMCTLGYKTVGNSCSERLVGDICRSDEECLMDFSICNGTCTCKHQYILTENKVCKFRDIGDPCETYEDCRLNIPDSSCINNTCSCNIGFKYVIDNSSECVTRSLSDFCNTDIDCSKSIGDSFCLNNTCQCKSGFISTGSGRCDLLRIEIDSCISDLDCSDAVNMSYCNNNTCSCKLGYISSSNGTTCALRIISDKCGSTDDCRVAVDNSFCFENKCQCISGFLANGNQTCVRRIIGDACNDDVDCSDAVQSSICKNNTCSCEAGHFTSTDKDRCTKRVLGDPCTDTQDCVSVEYADCINGTCQCLSEYKETNLSCVNRTVGDNCDKDYDCRLSSNSHCINNTCVCTLGYKTVGNSCSERLVGDICRSAEECLMDFSICNGTCTCKHQYIPTENKLCKFRDIGDPCETYEDCGLNIPDSSCINNTCSCDIGFKYVIDNSSECVLRSLSDFCNTEIDCSKSIGDSFCLNNTCQCKSGFISTGSGRCDLRRIEIDQCISDLDCSDAIKMTYCNRNNTCSCKLGYISSSNGSTCALRIISDKCGSTDDCRVAVDNSLCFENKCQCMSGFLANGNQTCLQRIIGNACNDDVDCSDAVQSSICKNNTCSCEAGHFTSTDKDRCTKRVLGDPCTDTQDCVSVEYADCINGTCQCLSEYKETNLSCVNRTVGDNCDNDYDCRLSSNSYCINNTCMCTLGYKTVGNSCSERLVGDICRSAEECLMDFSICNGTCTCKHQYIPTENKLCKFRDIGDPCETYEDCRLNIPDSSCINNTCSCDIGFKYVIDNSSECVLRSLSDFCNTEIDCSKSIGGSFCLNNTCQCKSGFISTGSGRCDLRRIEIDFCISDLDCSDAVNMSYCNNNTCSCKLGYISSSNGTTCALRIISDTCGSTDDCRVAVDNSFCFENKCQCISGFLANGNQTCVRRIIGNACNDDVDCSDAVQSSICKNNTCSCEAGHFTSTDKDRCTKRKINDSCTTDTDCSDAVAYSICSDSTCTCNIDYDVISNATECVKRPALIGEKCYFLTQCEHIDLRAECNATCDCPREYFVSDDRLSCIKLPVKIGELCSQHSQCVAVVNNSECGRSGHCQCRTDYFTDYNGTVCTKYAAKIGERCLDDVHCKFIRETICLNNTCMCTYKYEPSQDMLTCFPRKRMDFPQPANIWLGRLCNIKDETPCPHWNITNQICSSEDGRVNTRCRCKPGFANIYNAAECKEVQSYLLKFNITEELGCYPKENDQPRCYTFTEVLYLKQYSNNKTGLFRDMKLRIQILGLYKALNTTRLGSRLVASEVINMTKIPRGFQVNALIHITEDIYTVMNATVFSDVLLEYLESHGGLLAESGLKVGRPYHKNIYADDFDECTDWNGQASDCSPFAWCINTYGSYMCSCRYEYDDLSFDTSVRPGRVCIPERKKVRSIQECSDGKCETNWTWMGLVLGILLVMLIGFLAHEIYSKRQDIIKSDPTYVPVKRKSIKRALKNKDVTKPEEQSLINKETDTYEHDRAVHDDPPIYTEEP